MFWITHGAVLPAAGLKPNDLEGLRGTDPRKLALGDLLWRRTTVSQEWIASHLAMRSAANVSQQLRRFDRQAVDAKLPERFREFLERAWGADGE